MYGRRIYLVLHYKERLPWQESPGVIDVHFASSQKAEDEEHSKPASSLLFIQSRT